MRAIRARVVMMIVGLHVLGCRVDIFGTNCKDRVEKNMALFRSTEKKA